MAWADRRMALRGGPQPDQSHRGQPPSGLIAGAPGEGDQAVHRDQPAADCSDVAYGPQRLNANIGAYGAFLDTVCGTGDLSFHLVLELPTTETPSARRHPPTPNWII
jgi:hypothetical protein